MVKNFQGEAMLFQALSDEKRLQILDFLKDGECCACVLTEELGIAQSALSYHMKILCQSGLVSSRQEGKWKHYRLSHSGRGKALASLKKAIHFQAPELQCHCQKKSS